MDIRNKKWAIILYTLFVVSSFTMSIPSIADVVEADTENTCVYFFYGVGCPHCERADQHIQTLEESYPDLHVHRMRSSDNITLIRSLYESYGVPSNKQGYVPILFIGQSYFVGDTPIINGLESEIQKCEGRCVCPELIDNEDVPQDEVDDQDTSLLKILGLAVVDAVNPCELAVLIILMTAILSRFPKDRNRALKAGLAFSSAIFIMYFIFGILIISGFKFVAGFSQLKTEALYQVLGGLAILLGLLNIKDAIWYGGGGFIMEVPHSWRPRMKKIIKGTTSTRGAFVVGLIVSFFLTPCTAGPYFVFGGILSKISLLEALPYLFGYMCIFILPMVVITMIVYFGFMAVEDISGWRERNLKLLHWIAGLILLGLGVAMVLRLI
jgi:cytochrome c biogenesis protein CcdA